MDHSHAVALENNGRKEEHRVASFMRSLPGRMIVSILVFTLILGTLLLSSILLLSISVQKEFFVQNIHDESRSLAEMVGRDLDYLGRQQQMID